MKQKLRSIMFPEGSNSDFKSLLKEKEITEDEDKQAHDEVQNLTDKYVAEVDAIVAEKEQEILTV